MANKEGEAMVLMDSRADTAQLRATTGRISIRLSLVSRWDSLYGVRAADKAECIVAAK